MSNKPPSGNFMTLKSGSPRHSIILTLMAFCFFLCSCESENSATQANSPAPIEAETAPAKATENPVPAPDASPAAGEKKEAAKAEDAADSTLDSFPRELAKKNRESAPPKPKAAEAEAGAAPAMDPEKADKILEFHNNAKTALNSAYFQLPFSLHKNAAHYRETWALPKKPKIAGKAWGNKLLTAPKGLFTLDEEKQLARGLAEMNAALDKMLVHYRELEKYLADDSIRDDGKKGLELADQLDRGQGEFMAARRTWLEIVESNAARAENALLGEHPLRGQITAAAGMFAQFREIGEILKLDKPDREMLAALCGNISENIEQAEKPPFNAPPSLERLFRAFLKTAKNYVKVLRRGLNEGIFGKQKREILKAAKNCQDAYNKFAQAANQLSG